jgi:hypothetical protein
LNSKTYLHSFDYSNTVVVEKQVTEGFRFIRNHFTKPDWPRTISTKLTKGKQYTVYSSLEALSYFNTKDIYSIIQIFFTPSASIDLWLWYGFDMKHS